MFRIEWVPEKEIVALAKKRGMPEGDDCVLDYADETDCAKDRMATNFPQGVLIARDVLAEDFFGQVRLERIVLVRDRYTGDRWEADAVWYIDHDSTPKLEQPDHTPELDLTEDEEIVAG
jgi:hypothetical protein